MTANDKKKVDWSTVDFAAVERRALGVEVPEGVYYRQSVDNFYSDEGNGMGVEFHKKWFASRWLFPQRGWGSP